MLDRVFNLTQTETVQEFQEVATTLRTIADLRPLSADSAQRSLAVRGPADQVALAQWLVSELDKPANAAQGGRPDMHEYRLPGSSDIACVVHLSYAQTPQDLQEIATTLRTTTNIRRLYVGSARKMLTMRGHLDEIELAQWLINELGRFASAQQSAAQGQIPAVREYRGTTGRDGVAQVSYIAHAESLPQLQEITTLLRVVANVRRLFTYSRTKAVIMRGSQDEMALARWLVSELDQPPNGQPRAQQSQPPETHEYLPQGSSDVVRVFYLAHAKTPQEVQEVATLIRTEAGIRQLFTYNPRKALALRATADRIARAESLINEKDKPKAQ